MIGSFVRQQIILLISAESVLVVPWRIAGAAPFHIAADAPSAGHDVLNFIGHFPDARIVLCADHLAQDSRIDHLPRLSPFDRRRLIQRRLKQYFPQARLRGFRRARQARNAIFAVGLHASNPVFVWADRLQERSPVILSLPAEATRIMAQLAPEAAQGWVMMISRQASGDYRQIVTWRRDLVFTRLTPPAAEQDDAATVARDIKTSLDYLARHGLRAARDLTALVLLPENQKLTEHLAALQLGKIDCLTPHSAARRLRLPFAPAAEESAAGLLYAAAIVKQGAATLPLLLPATRQLRRETLVRQNGWRAAILTCVLVATHLLLLTAQLAETTLQTHRDTERAADSRRQLLSLQATAAPQTEPLGRLRLALERRRMYQQTSALPWRGIKQISAGLDDSVALAALDWQQPQNGRDSFHLSLRVRPESDDRALMVERFQQATRKIAAAAPDYVMTIVKSPFPSLAQDAITAASDKTGDPLGEISLQSRAP